MADSLPSWAQATIDRMNEEPARAKALLSCAGWPPIADGFQVVAADACASCGHPRIDVVEPGAGEVALSLVTSGCLVCDVLQVVDIEEVDLVEWDRIPGPEDADTSDEEG